MIEDSGEDSAKQEAARRAEAQARQAEIERDWHERITPEVTAAAIASDQEKLDRLRDTEKISLENYPVGDYIELQKQGLPLTKQAIGDRALVLNEEDFLRIGHLEFVMASGQPMTLDKWDFIDAGYGEGNPLRMLPEEFGDLPEGA